VKAWPVPDDDGLDRLRARAGDTTAHPGERIEAYIERAWLLARAHQADPGRPGGLDEAVACLHIALVDGLGGWIGGAPADHWLRGTLLLETAGEDLARAVDAEAAFERAATGAAGDGDDALRAAALVGVARAGELQALIAGDDPRLAVAIGHDLQDRIIAGYERALPLLKHGDPELVDVGFALAARVANRLLAAPGRQDDVDRLVDLLPLVPAEPPPGADPAVAARRVLMIARALADSYEIGARDELLDLLAELIGRTRPGLAAAGGGDDVVRLDLLLATAIVNAPPGGALSRRLPEVLATLEHAPPVVGPELLAEFEAFRTLGRQRLAQLQGTRVDAGEAAGSGAGTDADRPRGRARGGPP
jgi:hypothetical protein